MLIVEDNPVDARMVELALQQVPDWPLHISLVTDGDEACAFLQQAGDGPEVIRPDLIVLDLNLPRRTGTEVLEFIRSSPAFRTLTVVVLSSSPLDVIKDQVQDHFQPDCYFTKPFDLDEFMAIGSEIQACYLRALGRPLSFASHSGP